MLNWGDKCDLSRSNFIHQSAIPWGHDCGAESLCFAGGPTDHFRSKFIQHFLLGYKPQDTFHNLQWTCLSTPRVVSHPWVVLPWRRYHGLRPRVGSCFPQMGHLRPCLPRWFILHLVANVLWDLVLFFRSFRLRPSVPSCSSSRCWWQQPVLQRWSRGIHWDSLPTRWVVLS